MPIAAWQPSDAAITLRQRKGENAMSCECAHCGVELEGIDFAHEDECLEALDTASILAELDRALVEYDHELAR